MEGGPGWNDEGLYTWLASLAQYGLGAKRNTNEDVVGEAISSKETEVIFDPNWIELPSLETDSPENVRLVAWGSDRVVAVDSKYDEAERTVVIKAWWLKLGDLSSEWIGTPSQSVKDMRHWERPQCAMVGSRLYVVHPQWAAPLGPSERAEDVHLPVCVRSIDMELSAGWTKFESDVLLSAYVNFASVFVQSQRIIFVLKQWSLEDMFDEAIVYDTSSNRWMALGTEEKIVSVDNRSDNVQNDGGTVSLNSGVVIAPHFAEEHSCCYAINVCNKEKSFVMASHQDSYEEIMDEDEWDEGIIPWAEEYGRMCDFGAFISAGSLYILDIRHYTCNFDPENYFVRHDFSTKSCHYDDDGDRVWYRPTSKVPFPKPPRPLSPSVMIKVGEWLITGCKSNPNSPSSCSGVFQAIRIRDRPEQHSPERTRGKPNFVHLGLEYYSMEGIQPRKDFPRNYLSFLLALDPLLALECNEDGKVPLQLAIKNASVDGNMIRTILRANTKALENIQPRLPHKLFPQLLSSLQQKDGRTDYALKLQDTSNIYAILRRHPEMFPDATGISEMRKKRRLEH